MRRHLTGIGLAPMMVLAMFFAGGWGYLRLLRLPAPPSAPLSALPAGGGSLLGNVNVLTALAAVAGTAALAGILMAVPRVSPFAAGLPGLFALAWQALYVLDVHRALQVIPLRAHAFGAGWEALLFNGILGAAGLAMIIPIFLPSRWRGDDRDAEDDEASGFMADLRETPGSDTPPRAAVTQAAAPQTSVNPVPAGMNPTRPSRTGLVDRGPRPDGGPHLDGGPHPAGSPRPDADRMRPRPYRHPDGR